MNIKKGFVRSSTLSIMISIALSAYYGAYVLDETDVMDKLYKAAHRSNINSLEQGINSYIIDKDGQYPSHIGDLGSGTYEVCKQGMSDCPEGSISLDELVDEGYLKEIPFSYISQTDNLTGFKLSYNSNSGLVTIQNEQFSVEPKIQSKGTHIFNSDQDITNNNTYDNFNIIIAENVKVVFNGNYRFASIVNNGEMIVEGNKFELTANTINNQGNITVDPDYPSAVNLKFVAFDNFVNSGLISVDSMVFKTNEHPQVSNIDIIAKYLNLSEESFSGYSINGEYATLNLYYYENLGVEFSKFSNEFSQIKGKKIL